MVRTISTKYIFFVYGLFSNNLWDVVLLNNLVWLSRFIGGYLLLTLFATIRFLVSLFTDGEADFDGQTIRALAITIFYFLMWTWLWFKVKREILYKKILK